LHAGTIICSLGVRYRSYCSNIGRTFLIDPNKQQEKNYTFLLDVQRKILDAMKEGTKIKDVYARAMDFIRNKRPELEKKFVKNLGFGVSSPLYFITVLFLSSTIQFSLNLRLINSVI